MLTLITVTAWSTDNDHCYSLECWHWSLLQPWVLTRIIVIAWTALNVSLLLHGLPEMYHLLPGLPEISHCYCTVCLKSFIVTALSADTDHYYCLDCLKVLTYCLDCWKGLTVTNTTLCTWNLSLLHHKVLTSITVIAWIALNFTLLVLLHCVSEIFPCYSLECWHWSLLQHGLPEMLSLLLLGMQKFLMSLYGVLKCITVTAWTAGNVSLLLHGMLKFITVSVSMDCWNLSLLVLAWTAEIYHC